MLSLILLIYSTCNYRDQETALPREPGVDSTDKLNSLQTLLVDKIRSENQVTNGSKSVSCILTILRLTRIALAGRWWQNNIFVQSCCNWYSFCQSCSFQSLFYYVRHIVRLIIQYLICYQNTILQFTLILRISPFRTNSIWYFFGWHMMRKWYIVRDMSELKMGSYSFLKIGSLDSSTCSDMLSINSILLFTTNTSPGRSHQRTGRKSNISRLWTRSCVSSTVTLISSCKGSRSSVFLFCTWV